MNPFWSIQLQGRCLSLTGNENPKDVMSYARLISATRRGKDGEEFAVQIAGNDQYLTRHELTRALNIRIVR